MQELIERVAKLEAQDKSIFHQLDEIKEDVKDIRRLTSAVEKIAEQTKNTSERVAGINNRLDVLERAPTEDYKHYKRLIIGGILTGTIGIILGAILALVIK